MEEAKTAAMERAGKMMSRAIGMMRMKADAQDAIQNGVDPITAKQNALLNNADLLFSDNPQAVSSILNHEEANQVRERANLQLNQHREAIETLKALGLKQEKELNDQKFGQAQDKLDFQARELDLKHQIEQEKAAKQAVEPEMRTLTDPVSGQKMSVFRTGPNTWQATERKSGKVDELDKMELGSLYSELRSAERDLSALGQPTATDTEQQIGARTALVNRRSEIRKQINKLKDSAKSQPVAKPDATPNIKQQAVPDKPKLELKVDHKYRGEDGSIKVYKGADKDGNPIWEDWEG